MMHRAIRSDAALMMIAFAGMWLPFMVANWGTWSMPGGLVCGGCAV